MILNFPQNLHRFLWPSFNKMPTFALNFGLLCTLVKQTGREYFAPLKSNLSLLSQQRPSPVLALKTMFVGSLIAQGLNRRKAQSTLSWKSEMESTAERHGSR